MQIQNFSLPQTKFQGKEQKKSDSNLFKFNNKNTSKEVRFGLGSHGCTGDPVGEVITSVAMELKYSLSKTYREELNPKIIKYFTEIYNRDIKNSALKDTLYIKKLKIDLENAKKQVKLDPGSILVLK